MKWMITSKIWAVFGKPRQMIRFMRQALPNCYNKKMASPARGFLPASKPAAPARLPDTPSPSMRKRCWVGVRQKLDRLQP